MYPMGMHGFHHPGGHVAIDWSKIEPEHCWVLLAILGGTLSFMVCAVAAIIYFDDTPVPAPVRAVVRRQLTAVEKIV